MSRIELGFKTLSRVAVASAGTAQPISATSLLVNNVVLQWDSLNAGRVYVGESDVTATKCLVLEAATPSIGIDAEDTMADEDGVYVDLNKVYIDAANTGDAVFVSYSVVDSVKYNS